MPIVILAVNNKKDYNILGRYIPHLCPEEAAESCGKDGRYRQGTQLRRDMRLEEDPQILQQLQQRAADLSALCREGREIALHLERYYDRRYRANDKFSF